MTIRRTSTSVARRLVGAGAVCAASACGGDSPTAPAGRGTISIAGAGASDTILTPTPRLSVTVQDERGRPVAGARVELVPLAAPDTLRRRERTLIVCAAGPTAGCAYPGLVVGDPADSLRVIPVVTDAAGQVTTGVRLGTVAGEARLVVRAPAVGAVDTVHYTVRPGAPADVRVDNPDTAVYVGGRHAIRATVIDRFANVRDDSIAFTALTPAVAVEGRGVVRGAQLGRGRVLLRAGPLTATAWTSVAPQASAVVSLGFLGANGGTGLQVYALDGTAVRSLAGPPGGSLPGSPAWAPNGDAVTFAAGVDNRARLFTTSGSLPARRLVAENPAIAEEQSPRYSPDGTFVYFRAPTVPGRAQAALWRVASAGGAAERVAPDSIVVHPHAFDVSPNGERIAYVARNSELHLYDVRSGADYALGVSGNEPRWSPRGDVIAYAWSGYVRLIRADGSGGDRAVTTQVLSGPMLSWTRDGEWLVVNGGIGNFNAVRVATGEVLPLPLPAAGGRFDIR